MDVKQEEESTNEDEDKEDWNKKDNEEDGNEDKEDINKNEDKEDGNSKRVVVRFDEQNYGDDIKEKNVGNKERQVMQWMTDIERRELERDKVSIFWMRMENTECFDDITVYTVEVPVKEHKRVEVVEAKDKELENLEEYGVFEEVVDEGQETIGSRLVITWKEKADGQKTNYKGRLVAKGFQEKEAPQSDSPTMLRELMKIFFSVATNEDFVLKSINIRAAFYKWKSWIEIFFMPPKDVKKEGLILRLNKPLYVRSFVEIFMEKVSEMLDVLKIEDEEFRFTGIDIKKVEDGIEILMDDYNRSLEEIEIWEDRSDERLTREEMKVFRKCVGKLNC